LKNSSRKDSFKSSFEQNSPKSRKSVMFEDTEEFKQFADSRSAVNRKKESEQTLMEGEKSPMLSSPTKPPRKISISSSEKSFHSSVSSSSQEHAFESGKPGAIQQDLTSESSSAFSRQEKPGVEVVDDS